MFKASDRFFEAIRDSHTAVSKVEVYSADDELLLDSSQLLVLDGNISVDRTSSTRRTASLKLTDVDRSITPRHAGDIFHPLSNNYIRIYRGINFGKVRVPQTRTRRVLVNTTQPELPATEPIDAPYGHSMGSQVNRFTITPVGEYIQEDYIAWLEEDDLELIPQGKFDIFDCDIDDTRDSLTIDLKLFDFARKVERARLLRNHVVPAGTNFGTAIRDIIDQGVPGLTYQFPQINFVTPRLVFGSSGDQEGGDRWKYARDMAEAIGHELFFDRNGNIRLQKTPVEREQPILWDYSEGDRATLLYVTRNLSKEDTYNHVVAVGESTTNDEPVRGEAMDDDPSSPTYVGDPYGSGPYGAVPFFLRSNFIRTPEQATEAARAKLRQLQGTTEKMRIIITVNPAHDAGDRIRIVRRRSKLDCRFVMDSFNIPLEYSGPMNVTMRETRRITVGAS